MARGIHEVLNGHYIINHSKCFVSVSRPFMRCLWIVDLWKPGDLFRSNVPYPRVTVNSWRLRAGKSEAVSSKKLTPASEGLGVKNDGLNPQNKLQNTKCKRTYELSLRVKWYVVALLQRGPSRCYCSPKYTVVVYFCACTEMEKYVGAALQHPDSFLPSVLTRGSRGESFLLLHPWVPRAHFSPS